MPAKVKEFGVGFETVDGRSLVGCARLAEELGFGSFWIPEDYYFRGAFSLAGAVAASTERMRVGLSIINPYTRHPVLTAMEFAGLDELSGGRAVLGIGAGLSLWMKDQLHLPYEKPRVAMRESIALIRRLFSGDTVHFDGKVFRTTNVRLSFETLRPPPIHLGVIGPRNLEMAGEMADGVILSALAGAGYVEEAVRHVRVGAERAGRRLEQIEVSAILLISVSEDGSAAREAVKPFLATLLGLVGADADNPLLTWAGVGKQQLEPFVRTLAEGRPAIEAVTDDILDAFAVAGDPVRCQTALRRIVEAGVQIPIAFEIPGVPPQETLRSVHQHLFPALL